MKNIIMAVDRAKSGCGDMARMSPDVYDVGGYVSIVLRLVGQFAIMSMKVW